MPIESSEIAQYYTKYGPMVLRRCRQLLKSEDRALEAMQDTFVHLVQNKHVLTSDYPSSLLYTMATRICLNGIRDDPRGREQPIDTLLVDVVFESEALENIVRQNTLVKMFSGEKPSTALIAAFLFIDEMSLEEVARELHMSVSGIRKRMALLKQRVQSLKEISL